MKKHGHRCIAAPKDDDDDDDNDNDDEDDVDDDEDDDDDDDNDDDDFSCECIHTFFFKLRASGKFRATFFFPGILHGRLTAVNMSLVVAIKDTFVVLFA